MDLLELLCRKADLSFLALNFISERVSEVAMGEHDKILFLRLKCFSGFMASILYCLTSHLEYWIQGAVIVDELSHIQEKVQKFSVQTNWKEIHQCWEGSGSLESSGRIYIGFIPCKRDFFIIKVDGTKE